MLPLRKPFITIVTSLIAVLYSFHSISQCSDPAANGVNQGNLNIDGNSATYQTVAITGQDYYSVSVTCGDVYYFDFCGNGGSTSGLWPVITILDASQNVLDFSPYSGGCSQIAYAATFTGTITVYITDDLDGCTGAPAWTGTMAYNDGAPSLNYTNVTCGSADASLNAVSGGVFAFNPVPGGGVSLDVSGNITNGTPGATYTVEYTDPSCGNTISQSVTLNAADASFTLTEACGGGTATVAGTSGGTFSFNPAPGDGAQVNATTGTISNGTTGTTYSIQYSVCGASTTESVTVLTDDCWTLNGDAQYINVSGENCIQLTDEINNQTGCAWSGSQIDFNSDFSLSLDYYFGNNVGGADGNTFTFQPSASTACGQNGGQLGAGGLTNALSIEFDTYDNDNPAHVFDLLCDHVAIETDGDHMNGLPAAGPACAKSGGGNIDDGGLYQVEITWDASAQTLNVYFDGVWVLDFTEDIVNNVFGGQNLVYWGATSATGGLNNQQYFCPSSIVILPVNLSKFESYCNGETEVFEWTTESEQNTDYFVLEYTYDGLIYYPQEYVVAAGSSETTLHYSARVDYNDTKDRYYRIKTVDFDGSIETSDIISSKNCANKESLIKSVNETETQVDFYLNEKSEIFVYNMMGQKIATLEANEICSVLKNSYSSGVYQIHILSESGRNESRKIVIRH